jgi:hypothetical protein
MTPLCRRSEAIAGRMLSTRNCVHQNRRQPARSAHIQPPYGFSAGGKQIGKRGQLQEWIEDYGENEPQHRHVSHLYSLYPGHDISLKVTPELAAAVKKSPRTAR